MKKLLFNFMFMCIGTAFFAGCSSDDTIMQSDEDTNVSLRHSLVIQPNSVIDDLAVSYFPQGLPIPPYNFPAGTFHAGLPTTELNIHAWTNSGYRMNSQHIIKFNILSYLKTTNKVNRAILKLKSIPGTTSLNQSANHGSANAFNVQQIASYFTAGSIASSGLPAIRNQVSVPHTNSPMLDVDIDVTALVRDMVNNNRDYGFMLRLSNETTYNCRLFCSASYPTVSMRPSLVIDFD